MSKRRELDGSLAFETPVGTTILNPDGPPVFLEGEAETAFWIEHDPLGELAKFSVSHPRAAAVLHVIIARMDHSTALVASQADLAAAAGCSTATLRRAIAVLKQHNWLQVLRIGPTAATCAYIVNQRVTWSEKRDGVRYSMFSAAVLLPVADDASAGGESKSLTEGQIA